MVMVVVVAVVVVMNYEQMVVNTCDGNCNDDAVYLFIHVFFIKAGWSHSSRMMVVVKDDNDSGRRLVIYTEPSATGSSLPPSSGHFDKKNKYGSALSKFIPSAVPSISRE